MLENNRTEPEDVYNNQLGEDFIKSKIEKFFQEKETKIQTLEKKIPIDIECIEVLKYSFVDMLKYGKNI
jgi:hypothetical protein